MVLISSTTKTNLFGSTLPETSALQAALKNSSRSTAPALHSLAEAESLEKPPEYVGFAQSLARKLLQQATSLKDGGRRALLHVVLEQLLCGSVGLRWPSATLSRGE